MFPKRILPLGICCLAAALGPNLSLRAENKIPNEFKTGGMFIGCQAYTFNHFTVFEAIEKTAQCGGKVIEFYPGQKLSKEEPNVAWDHNASPETIQKVKDKLAEFKIKAVNYGVVQIPKDEAQARKLFEKAAQAGNPRGVSNLAALGGSGGAAPADPVRARELLGKAGETNAEAQYQLGLMLSNGTGGEKDDVAARALFEKAAGQNHPGALERMGAFAQEGRGGPKDAAAAKAYYERAATLGDEDAKKALERIRCPYAIKDKRGNLVTTLCF